MKPEAQRAAIAEVCGFRRWGFGDPWKKGLRLADNRFSGYVRRVIKDAPANSTTVKLDIDEAWTQQAEDVRKNYTPLSHWVAPSGVVVRNPPDYLNDLNAMNEAEKVWFHDDEHWLCYEEHLRGFMPADCLRQQVIGASAVHRAEAFLRTLNLWVEDA